MKKFLIVIFYLLFVGLLTSQDKFKIDEQEKKFIHHFFLAEKHKALEEYNKAILEYESCIKLKPNESAIFFELGKLYFSQGFIDESLGLIKQANNINPNNIWYLYFLLEIYYQTSDYENQALTWKKLIEIDDENEIYYLELIKTYFSSNLIKKALKEISKAQKIFKNNYELIILKSEAFQKY